MTGEGCGTTRSSNPLKSIICDLTCCSFSSWTTKIAFTFQQHIVDVKNGGGNNVWRNDAWGDDRIVIWNFFDALVLWQTKMNPQLQEFFCCWSNCWSWLLNFLLNKKLLDEVCGALKEVQKILTLDSYLQLDLHLELYTHPLFSILKDNNWK